MELNKFKPSWQFFKLVNSLEEIDHLEILSIIEKTEQAYEIKRYGLMPNSVVFGLIVFICQSC